MIDLPDPRSPLNKQEQLVLGVDATRHPCLGIPIGHGNGDPNEQAFNWLRSMLGAGKLTEQEFKDLWRRLTQWQAAGGVVNMPPRTGCADHPEQRRT